jgi:predicted nuclease with TOPRIM domain
MKQETLQHRLEALRAEFEKGQKQLRDLHSQQISLQETMLRIQGAMQVLEEVLAEDAPKETAGVHSIEAVSGRKAG